MKTVVINNQKGGVGKTMLAVHLAWYLAEEEGARVAFLDFDPQGNASYTLRGEPKSSPSSSLFYGPKFEGTLPAGLSLFPADPKLRSVERQADDAIGGLILQFRTFRDKFDYCVIDTPPVFDARNLGAFIVSDALLAPIDLEDYSIQGIGELRKQRKMVEQVREGPPLAFLGYLPSRFVANQPRQKRHLEELLKTIGTQEMFPGVIRNRSAYGEAVSVGRPVWTLPSSAAREAGKELRGVLETVKTRVAG